MTVETAPLPTSARPGPEMELLAPFYREWSWTGTIEPGGMGPGTPRMTGVGRARCRLEGDGLWYACDFEQEQCLDDGTPVLTWRLHWVSAWDGNAHEYRATSVDNQGPNVGLYRGSVVGERLTYESIDRTLPRIRLTWILRDAAHCTWRNEVTPDGQTWQLIEEYEMEAP